MHIQFLGAARQVTGSQYYIEVDGAKLIVDCGMFQEREHQARNWEPSPIALRAVDAVLLTHAHLDHCGLAPKLVRDGLRSPIYATTASAELAEIVLRDSAAIQEEDAAFKQKRHRKEGRQGRFPVQPLYTLADVERTVPRLEGVAYGQEVPIKDTVSAVFHDAGHILGSAMIEIRFSVEGQRRNLIFSGDIGLRDKPWVRDPTVFTHADYLVMESTYGARPHPENGNVREKLAEVVRGSFERGGKLLIPIFAIERAQELIWHLGGLLREKRIPEMLVFLDSPMACDVIEVFRRHEEMLDDDARKLLDDGLSPLTFPGLKVVRSTEDSKKINDLRGPAIIMSTSGMCTAGRIKHHLAHHIGDPKCTVLFVGYQAQGTLGRQIVNGVREVRIHGRSLLVRARVLQIHGLSGHADQPALVEWSHNFQQPPRQVFITHGEMQDAQTLAELLHTQLGWNTAVPGYQERVELV